MAKKFIDADILFKNITDHHYLMKSSSNSTDYGMFTTGIKQAIDEQPSADVQEVVRCKECKYLKYDRDFTTGRYCSLRNANGGKYCKDDDYCSYGKRKEGDKNNG